jgi:hypothetical protein
MFLKKARTSMTKVLARLTVTRKNGARTIVEVRADATFHKFYRFYRQSGSKRSTKTLIRTASRNEGLNPVNAHQQVPGLELIALRLRNIQAESNPVESIRLRYFSKRAYRKLINAAPDQLGMTRVEPIFKAKPVKALIPLGPYSHRWIAKLNHKKLHAGA